MTTDGVISFVFTVALGGASVVLAMLAIVLSSQAERALATRSEASIRLQNEIFNRTQDVLAKIQASTGVTEKRIEDIAAGRTGLIAREVVERALPADQPFLSRFVTDRLKDQLETGLRDELSHLGGSRKAANRHLEELEARQARRHKITQRWDLYKNAVIAALESHRPDVKVISTGSGDPLGGTQEAFWDAIVETNGRRAAIDLHTRAQLHPIYGTFRLATDPDLLEVFIAGLLHRFDEDAIHTAFLAADAGWVEIVQRVNGLLDERDPGGKRPRLRYIEGTPDSVASEIVSALRKEGEL